MVKVLMFMRVGVDRLRRRIKIIKPDGTVLKLSGPVCAKEILIDYPNHRILEAAAFGGLGIGSLPLAERARLVAGRLYYLIPLPFPHHEFLNNNRGHFAKPASSRLQPPSIAGRTAADSRKQREGDDPVVNKINRGGVRIFSSSYSTHGSTVRVKLRLRREDLASFLSANNVNVVMARNVLAVPPSIQDASRQ